MPNVNPVGKIKNVDIIGCHTKPEQFKISKDEHGSIYLLTIASAICKLLGAYLYHICPIWVCIRHYHLYATKHLNKYQQLILQKKLSQM